MDKNLILKLLESGKITHIGFIGEDGEVKETVVSMDDTKLAGYCTLSGAAEKIAEGKVEELFKDVEPAPAEPVKPLLTSTMVTEMTVGDVVEFVATTVANDWAGVNVYSTVEISPYGKTTMPVKVEYLEVKDGNWYELPFTKGVFKFGADAGFPCADASSTFRVTATKECENASITSKLIEAETGETIVEVKSTLSISPKNTVDDEFTDLD